MKSEPRQQLFGRLVIWSALRRQLGRFGVTHDCHDSCRVLRSGASKSEERG